MLLDCSSNRLTALTKRALRVVLSIPRPPYLSQRFQKQVEALNSELLHWKANSGHAIGKD